LLQWLLLLLLLLFLLIVVLPTLRHQRLRAWRKQQIASLCGSVKCVRCADPTCVSSQDRQTSKITAAFKNLIPNVALAIRDGQESSIPATDLVKGDVVRVRTGTRVPADIRLIHVAELKVGVVQTVGSRRVCGRAHVRACGCGCGWVSHRLYRP
jgi:magnesium-transporting ATPase (P-type)